MACWARTILEAAMSSMARVIFWVDWTLRMRRRRILSWPAGTPLGLPGGRRRRPPARLLCVGTAGVVLPLADVVFSPRRPIRLDEVEALLHFAYGSFEIG